MNALFPVPNDVIKANKYWKIHVRTRFLIDRFKIALFQ